MVPQLYITRTLDGNNLPLPSYHSKYHVGLELLSAISSTIKINPGERLRIPIGFAIGIPQGFAGEIVSSPELAMEAGIIVPDAPHILNPADREPIFVLLQNISNRQYILHRGDKIAELIITPVVQVCWKEIITKTPEKVTQTEDIILEDEKEEAKPKHDPFSSLRREKHSIRNRFKSVDDETA